MTNTTAKIKAVQLMTWVDELIEFHCWPKDIGIDVPFVAVVIPDGMTLEPGEAVRLTDTRGKSWDATVDFVRGETIAYVAAP